MTSRSIKLRLADGDFSGGKAIVRIRRGAQTCAEISLTPGRPAATVELAIDADHGAAGGRAARRPYDIEVEYQWGYAREAWYRGSADVDVLVLCRHRLFGHWIA